MNREPSPPDPQVEKKPSSTRLTPPRSPIVWSLFVMLLMGASGAVRAWQEQRFGSYLTKEVHSPFPLSELPSSLGDGQWLAQGADIPIDSEILKVAGASDYLLRSYAEPSTGVMLTVMVLFGRGDRVFGHTPEICLPSSGFSPLGPQVDRAIPTGSGTALFRSAAYYNAKSGPGSAQEIYHGFRYRGRWIPDASALQKEFRFDPRLVKVQVQRRIVLTEQRDRNDPVERFLSLFLDSLESKLAAVERGETGVRRSGPTAPSPVPSTSRDGAGSEPATRRAP